MYQTVIVCNYMICKKTAAGNVPTYNNVGKFVKVIEGVSEADCKKQAEEFLQQSDFLNLKRESS